VRTFTGEVVVEVLDDAEGQCHPDLPTLVPTLVPTSSSLSFVVSRPRCPSTNQTRRCEDMNISKLDAIEETVSDTFPFSLIFIDNVLLELLSSHSVGL
jgi:hypothetical protein